MATTVHVHRCSDCKLSSPSPSALPPTGWRYGIDRMLRCYGCSTKRLTSICLRNQYRTPRP